MTCRGQGILVIKCRIANFDPYFTRIKSVCGKLGNPGRRIFSDLRHRKIHFTLAEHKRWNRFGYRHVNKNWSNEEIGKTLSGFYRYLDPIKADSGIEPTKGQLSFVLLVRPVYVFASHAGMTKLEAAPFFK